MSAGEKHTVYCLPALSPSSGPQSCSAWYGDQELDGPNASYSLERMSSVPLLQVATVSRRHLNANGQPNLDGWARLKWARKEAVFMGIMGTSSCLKGVPLTEISPSPSGRAPVGRGGPMGPGDVEALKRQGEEDNNEDEEEGEGGAEQAEKEEMVLPPISAAQVGAASDPNGATHPPPGFLAVVPEYAWKVLAELEKAGRTPRDPAHLDFAGKLKMADDIALTFLLAAEGKLDLLRPQKPRRSIRSGVRNISTPAEYWQWRRAVMADPDAASLDDRRDGLCQPLEKEISTEGGSAEHACLPPGDKPQWVGEGSGAHRENEETGRTTWYAVTALDKGRAEQLLEFLQANGYPQRDNLAENAGDVLRIVEAAQHKGQGLLLTVEEVHADEYEVHKEGLVELYYEKYGHHPYRSRDWW